MFHCQAYGCDVPRPWCFFSQVDDAIGSDPHACGTREQCEFRMDQERMILRLNASLQKHSGDDERRLMAETILSIPVEDLLNGGPCTHAESDPHGS